MERSRLELPLIDGQSDGAEELGAPSARVHPAPPDSTEHLKGYLQKKQTVSRAIHSLHDFLDLRDSKARLEECHELLVKLAEDRFTLAVVGQFKRGKSSLMNAVIGRNLLPTGLLPLTSAVTILRFGPVDKLVIPREGWSFAQEAPISSLPEFVTERGNPGNQKGIKGVYVETPAPFLRRGLEFVDTPGIGSAIEANTRTTYEFIPQCDAVLFVTSVDTPLTNAETAFLQLLRQHVRKLFFVVNKTDLLGENERAEVLDFITATLKRETGAAEVRIFPVSSQAALAAKLRGEQQSAGGMAELEAALGDFLSTEKASALLVAVLDKALRLLLAESRELDLQTRAHQASGADLEEKLGKLKQQIEQMRQARRIRIDGERKTVVQQVMQEFDHRLTPFLQDESNKLTTEVLDWVGCARWELSDALARGFVANMRPRLQREVSAWVARESAVIDGQLRAAATKQRKALVQDVKAISSAAEDVFALGRKDLQGNREISADLKVVFAPPPLAEMNGRIRVPLSWRVLPAFLNRSWLIRFLMRESKSWLGLIENGLTDAVKNGVSTTVAKLAEQVETEAAKAEKYTWELVAERHSPDPTRARPVLTDSELGERRTQLQHRLESLRDHVMRGEALETTSEKQALAHVPDPVLRRKVDPETKKSSPAGMFSPRNCPVCSQVKQSLFDFFAGWQNMLAGDDAAQEAFADELGFCPVHTWHLVTIASPLGLSTGYVRLVDRLSAEMSRKAGAPIALNAIEVATSETCRACRAVRRAEAAQVERVCRLLQDDEDRQAYTKSFGLCIRHLGMVMNATHTEANQRLLLTVASKRFEEISEDMQSYALKRQAIRGALLNRDEEDAYLRALVHIVGDRYLADPTPADVEL